MRRLRCCWRRVIDLASLPGDLVDVCLVTLHSLSTQEATTGSQANNQQATTQETDRGMVVARATGLGSRDHGLVVTNNGQRQALSPPLNDILG